MKNEKYVRLASDIDLRKEYFGCLCYRKSIGKIYQFNHDGFRILYEYLKPQAIHQAMYRILSENKEFDQDKVFEFYIHCFEQGILEFVHQDASTKELIGGDWISENINYLKAPFACTIYITDLCPKACRHCITNSSPKVSTAEDLTTEQWKRSFELLRDAGVMQLIITGGDPLVREDIFELLHYADKLGFYISLLTDYDDLQEYHIIKIKSIQNLRYIQTSLDGSSSKTHDFIRGKGSFKKTIMRLELLHKHKINHTISTSVFKKNLDELYEIARLSKKYNSECLYLNPIAPYGRGTKFPDFLLLDDSDLKRLATIYFDLIKNHGINSGNSFWQEQVKRGIDNFDPSKPFFEILDSVTIATTLCSINSKGEIYLDSKLKAEKILKLGNILEDGILKPWNREVLVELRKNFEEGVPLKFVHIDEVKKLDDVKFKYN